MSKSFILKSPSNKKQPNLLHWKAQKQMNFILIPYHWETLFQPYKNILEIFFPSLSFTWKDVYILPRIVTTNITLHVFQYKVLNDA